MPDIPPTAGPVTTEPAAAPAVPAPAGAPAPPEPPTVDADGAPADGDRGAANREAARYRTQLRAAETERDGLRDQLSAQHRAIVDWRATNNPSGPVVDPALLDAAGISIGDLLDDTGHLDMAAVDQFIDSAVTKFGLPRGFVPNPAQGAAGHTPAGPSSLGDAFKQLRP